MLTEPVRSTPRCQVGPRVPPTEERLQGKPQIALYVVIERKVNNILHFSVVVHVLTILLYTPLSASKYTTHTKELEKGVIYPSHSTFHLFQHI